MEKESKKSVTIVNKIVDHCDKYKNVYVVGGTILANYLIFKSDGISINIIKNSELINSAVGIGNKVIGNGYAGKVVKVIRNNGTSETFESINSAAKALSVSPTTVRRYLEAGKALSDGSCLEFVGNALSK